MEGVFRFDCVSHVWHPVGAVLRTELAGDDEDDVDNPPDAEAAKSEEFADRRSGLAHAEPVEAEKPQEDGVQEGGEEVVVGVLDAGVAFAEEDTLASALDAVQGSAAHRSLLNLFPTLPAVSQTTVACVNNNKHLTTEFL